MNPRTRNITLAALATGVALLAGLTLAQDTAASLAGLWQEVVIPALLTLASGLIGYLAVLGSGVLKRAAQNQENQLVARALDLVGQTAVTAVAETAQTAVQQLKAAHADGKLTREEANAALAYAASRVWATIGKQARETLAQQAGGDSKAAIDAFVKPAVEQQVALLDRVLPASEPVTGEAERERTLMLARSKLGLDLQ